ncbi:NO-inducible flavohemoprotein [Chryseobacterium sp.]|uniref:NO-inducible flavohemoprotein n=1 Tax=Chryseobacterium sp. TaxID=1871047 RepID=UPI0031DD4550
MSSIIKQSIQMTSNQKNLVKQTVPILREHGIILTTYFYNRMFRDNPELKHIFNMGNQKNNKQQAALAMTVLAYADNIEDPSVLMPVLNNIGHKHTSLDIRPEQYTIVGKHLIASISEVLGESATPELLEAWSAAYQQLALLMSGHEQTIYNHRINNPGGWAGWRPFIVKQKVRESTEITSFYLYPSDGGIVADFTPGQYISLRLFLPELELLQPRQYSISCAPNSEYYRISVKKETGNSHPNGIISNRLHNHVNVGDLLDISAPAGNFVLQEETEKQKVFISGGVGQTPLLAMLEQLTQEKTKNKNIQITWIHGCRDQKTHAFKERVTEISNKNKNVSQHIFYETIENTKDSLNEGWLDLSKLKQDILQEHTEYYICGPAAFITKHYNFLLNNNVPKTDIYFEEFGPASLQLD